MFLRISAIVLAETRSDFSLVHLNITLLAIFSQFPKARSPVISDGSLIKCAQDYYNHYANILVILGRGL